MQATKVDVWVVICRENNNDPIADYIGGENAGGTAAFLFYFDENGFHSKVYYPEGEAKTLDELDIHDEVVYVKRGELAIEQSAQFLMSGSFNSIAVNSSSTNSMDDGLTWTQRKEIENYLGNKADRLVSSTELIYEWLSIKLPQELEIMKKAALTAQWQIEAYNQVVPGKTTDVDVARFLKAKMVEYGVTDAWTPDQNPNVNSGPDRGHSHATNKVIMPGNVMQTDFGIKLYNRWVTDIQRFAYVLEEGKIETPSEILNYWEAGKAGNRAAYAAKKLVLKELTWIELS